MSICTSDEDEDEDEDEDDVVMVEKQQKPKVGDHVWAGIRSFPWWPSEVIDVGEDKVTIRLFGTAKNEEYGLPFDSWLPWDDEAAHAYLKEKIPNEPSKQRAKAKQRDCRKAYDAAMAARAAAETTPSSGGGGGSSSGASSSSAVLPPTASALQQQRPPATSKRNISADFDTASSASTEGSAKRPKGKGEPLMDGDLFIAAPKAQGSSEPAPYDYVVGLVGKQRLWHYFAIVVPPEDGTLSSDPTEAIEFEESRAGCGGEAPTTANVRNFRAKIGRVVCGNVELNADATSPWPASETIEANGTEWEWRPPTIEEVAEALAERVKNLQQKRRPAQPRRFD